MCLYVLKNVLNLNCTHTYTYTHRICALYIVYVCDFCHELEHKSNVNRILRKKNKDSQRTKRDGTSGSGSCNIYMSSFLVGGGEDISQNRKVFFFGSVVYFFPCSILYKIQSNDNNFNTIIIDGFQTVMERYQ